MSGRQGRAGAAARARELARARGPRDPARVPGPSRRLADDDSLLAVGRLAGPHGLRGEFKFAPFLDEDSGVLEVLAPRAVEGDSDAVEVATVWLGSRDEPDRDLIETTVEDLRGSAARPIILLALVRDRTEAERTPRYEVFLPKDLLGGSLDEGEFFVGDVVGCRAETIAGESMGEVVGVEEGSAHDLLLVKHWADRPPFRVPFVDALVPTVDLANRRIVLDLPEGLTDL